MHLVKNCQYSTHRCRQCNRVGHKESYCECFTKQKFKEEEKRTILNPKLSTRKSATFSSSRGKTKSIGVYIVNHITQHSSKRKFIPAIINGIATKLQLDTASDITIISKQTWKKLGKPKTVQPTIEAINASGKPLHLSGEFQCTGKGQRPNRTRNRQRQDVYFNKKHRAVKRTFQHGDAVYVKIHRNNFWQW